MIVNKETYDTARVLHYAIDNGYVIGTQFYSGYGIVNGFLEACQALGKDGRDILLNSWLRIHPELRGTCDPETRMINEDNELHVCVQAQADLRRKASEFNWMCVDDNALRPTVQHLQSEGGDRDKEIWASARIIVGGTNLKYTASTDKVTAGWNTVDASTGAVTSHEVDIVPESSGASNMVLPFPTGLATAPVGTAVTFTFNLRQGIENAAVLPAVCKATLVANPTTPTITKVTQEGRADDTVKLNATSPCVIHGANLALGTGDKVLIELYQDGQKADEGDLTLAGKVTSSTDTAINLSGFYWCEDVPVENWYNAYPNSKLIVVKGGVRYEHPLTFKGE